MKRALRYSTALATFLLSVSVSTAANAEGFNTLSGLSLNGVTTGKGPVNAYGAPMGPNVNSTVFNVLLADPNTYTGFSDSTGPVGTDGLNGIDGWTKKNFDGIGLYVSGAPITPHLTIAQDTPDSNNLTHRITFDKGIAYFSPALNSTDISRLSLGQYVVTNVVGSTRSAPSVNDRKPVNVWTGHVTAWDSAGTWIKVDGWRVLGANMGAGNYVPGAQIGNPGDQNYLAANTYDPIFGHTGPALMIGTVTREIPAAINCTNADASTTNSNTITSCDALDVSLTNSAAAGTKSLRGITVNFSGNSATSDSYDLALNGNTASLMRLSGGPNTVEVNGQTLWVNGPGGFQTVNPNEQREVSEVSQTIDNNDRVRLVTSITRTGTQSGSPSASLDLGLYTGGTPGNLGAGVTKGAYFRLNPVGYVGGIQICGSAGCGITVNAAGDVLGSNGNPLGAGGSGINLSAYLKVADAETTYAKQTALQGYVTTQSLTNYVQTPALAAYALKTDLQGYVTSDALAGYAKTSDLNNYLTAASLTGYVQSSVLADFERKTALSADIAAYLTAHGYTPGGSSNNHAPVDLTGYVKQTDLTTKLGAYETTTDLATKLANYVQPTYVTNALAPYEKSADLTTTLNDYVKSTDLTKALSAYEKSSDLTTTLQTYALKTDIPNTSKFLTSLDKVDASNATISALGSDPITLTALSTNVQNNTIAIATLKTQVAKGTGNSSTAAQTVTVQNLSATKGAVSLTVPTTGDAAFDITPSADTTLSFTGTGTKGQLQKITLLIRQPSTGGFNVVLPTNVSYANSMQPAVPTTSSSITPHTFVTDDGGATWALEN